MNQNKPDLGDLQADSKMHTQTHEQVQQSQQGLHELPEISEQQALPDLQSEGLDIDEQKIPVIFGESLLAFMLATLFSGVVYAILFYLNAWLTQYLEDVAGVNWVYLPAGLRLFLTLIFGLSGALGIALASFAISFVSFYEGQWITCAGIGIASGFAPLLARFVVVRGLDLNADLSGLNYPKLVQCILVYAALSSALHQYWFALRDLSSAGADHWVVMFVGDVFGSVLLIALIKTIRDWMATRHINKSFIA